MQLNQANKIINGEALLKSTQCGGSIEQCLYKVPRENGIIRFFMCLCYFPIIKAIGRHSHTCKDLGTLEARNFSPEIDGEIQSFQLR